MIFEKRRNWIVAVIAVVGLTGAMLAFTTRGTGAQVPNEVLAETEISAGAGQIDDGASLLPDASITLEQAVSAAQAAAHGPVGEVDLEYYAGKLVFNAEVGPVDVKVDAGNGDVLGTATD